MNDDPIATVRPGIDRRGLLKLAAAAGVLPFLPGTTVSVQAAKAIGTAVAGCTPLPVLSGPEFPVVAFWPPSMQSRFNTLARFQEMKNAGFTATFVGARDADDVEYVHTTLSYTDQTGLKAIVVNWPERALQLREEYVRHPSFAGFRLDDEPSAPAFPRLGTGSAALRAAAPGLLQNINLLPDVGQGWRGYIQEFISVVRPQVLSYDRYPLYADGTDHSAYFAEWLEFRAAGLGTGLPTWIYILSVIHWHYRMPTAAELAWQVNISLAYGCKGIQYFCYWSPEPPPSYGPALIDYEGNRSPVYDAATTLNTTWLAPVGAELKPLVSEWVTHANGSRPPGTIPFTPDTYLTATSGSPIVVSRFRGKDRKPRTRWLLLANPKHSATTQATLNVNTATVTAVSRFDPATRTYQAQSSPATISVTLAPGAAALYRLDAPGAYLDPQMQLVAVASGSAHHAIQQVGDSWDGPNGLGGPSRLVAASEYNGTLNVVEMAGDVIYHRVRSVDGSWGSRNEFSHLGGVSSVAAAVVVGCLQLAFAAGGVVYHAMQFPDGRWDGPNRLGDASDLVAATEHHACFHMIQVAGSRIYHRVRHPNGTWSSRNLFVTMAGITSVAVTVVGEEMMVVLAAAGQLYYAVQHTDGSWQWPTLTGDQADQVAACSVGGELQITATSGGKAFIRSRRADGTLSPRVDVPTLTDVTALATSGRSPEPCP
ncbi:hypothetical protein [Kribbella deserti]|uniref:Twin-arginine translocation signal domain-containing protein n=1 Tax=Kribbella deserti TaxID=1926257 RepID=A0ABV6QI07_9ACTN